jgi:diguanylate cyclase (GGDEF)-like protein
MFEKIRLFDVYALSNRVALPVALVLFAWIATVDWITSYQYSLDPFYLILVGLVTWNCGWKWGLFFSIFSVINQTLIGMVSGQSISDSAYFYVLNFNKLFSDVVVVALLARLKVLHEREKSSARVDFLTGASNNMGFHEALGVELARHRRDGESFSVAYLDCDNFKQVNDTFGHKMGDVLLVRVIETMNQHLRRTDVVARLGGDEFAIVLPKTNRSITHKIISKLRQELDAAMVARNWPVTFSIGVGIFLEVPKSEDDVISFTDQLMYRVKAAGKSNVIYDEFEFRKLSSTRQSRSTLLTALPPRRGAAPH